MDASAQIWFMPILVWVAALVIAGFAIWNGPRPLSRGFVIDRLLRYVFLFPLGMQSLWAFIGHVLYPDQAAAVIGWTPSPFQYEVGVANLGLGLASIYAALSSFQARVAVGILAVCFLLGAGIGHVRDIIEAGNFAPGNSGPIMITDFLTPIVLVVLLFAAVQKPKSSATIALEAELRVARKALRDYRSALDSFGRD